MTTILLALVMVCDQVSEVTVVPLVEDVVSIPNAILGCHHSETGSKWG